MTKFSKEQAEILAWIIGTADGGCQSCVSSLCSHANDKIENWHFKHNEEYCPLEDQPSRIIVEITPK